MDNVLQQRKNELALSSPVWLFAGYLLYLVLSVASSSGGMHATFIMYFLQIFYAVFVLTWCSSIRRVCGNDHVPETLGMIQGLGSRLLYGLCFILSLLAIVYWIHFSGGITVDPHILRYLGLMAQAVTTLSIFCVIGVVFVTAKIITSKEIFLELTRRSDSTGTFFLMLFFPIGIWFIHRRVRRIYSAKDQLEF